MKWVLFLILGFCGLAHGDNYFRPKKITEDVRDKSFLNQTRLKCVSDGVYKATGLQPSQRYLGLIAFAVREKVELFSGDTHYDMRVDDAQEQQMKIRLPYLNQVMSFVANYGFCTSESSEMTSDEARTLREAISGSRSASASGTADEVAKDASGTSFEKLTQIFNTQGFYGMSAYEQAAAAQVNTDKGLDFTHIAGSPYSKKLRSCLEALKKHQAPAGFEERRMKLCTHIVEECGHNQTICNKYKSSAASAGPRSPSSIKKSQKH